MRPDGRRVKNMDAMYALIPQFLPHRYDAMNMITLNIPVEPMKKYMNEKRAEGRPVNHLALIIAAYLRTAAEFPQLNRFVGNKKIYAHKDFTVSMVVLRPGGEGDTMSKVYLDYEDDIFTVQEKKRPYVILKWAQTYDHFIGKRDLNGLPQPMAISNTLCMTSVHHQRGIEGGILVGGGTVRSDNSRLTCRLWPSQHQPTRMILSPSLNIPEDVAMFCQEGQTLVFNGKREADYGSVKFIKVDFEAGREAEQVMQIALNRGIQSVIVEGGAHTLSRFIKQGMWDEAYVYEGQQIVNTGVRAPVLSALPDREVAMGWDCILRHYTRQGSVPKSFAL